MTPGPAPFAFRFLPVRLPLVLLAGAWSSGSASKAIDKTLALDVLTHL